MTILLSPPASEDGVPLAGVTRSLAKGLAEYLSEQARERRDFRAFLAELGRAADLSPPR